MSAGPGWHPDAQRPGQLRYWDGERWTDFRVTAPTSVPVDSASWTRRHPMWTGALAVIVLLFFVAVITGTDEQDPANEVAASSIGDATPEADEVPETAPEPTPESTPTPERAEVPALVGKGVERARDRLQNAGLDVRVRKAVSVRRPGTVLRQSSRAGRALLVGSAVTLVVSAPWPRVPRVTGLSTAAAASRLRQAGFKVTTVLRRTTSGRDGVVLEQNVMGRAMQPHSTIRMVVADYHKPAPPPPPKAAPSNCTGGYSPCLAPMYDYDCAGGSGDGPGYVDGPVYITGSDPYDLDRDGDGVACED